MTFRSNSKLIPAGYCVTVDPDIGGGTLEQDTLQCVHCQAHFLVPLTGTGSPDRGFCHKCNGPICGEKCIKCVPAEQQLENMEQGRDILYVPVRVGFNG